MTHHAPIQILPYVAPTPGRTASARESQAWLALATLFGYPDAALLEALDNGVLRDHLVEVLDTIDPALTAALPPDAFLLHDETGMLATEYTRLFYLGDRDTPLCALHEGSHQGNRMEVMEEVLRFYRHFGLSIRQTPNEMPDHLVSELEFLHFLSFQQAHCLRHGEDAGPYQRASKDFITRHASRWMPDIGQSLATMDAHPFYQDAGRLLTRFVRHQLARLQT